MRTAFFTRAVANLVSRLAMNAQRAILMIAVGAIVLTSCASYASPEVSGPYAGRFTQDDIRQIAQLPFTQSRIHRGVHTIYVKKPDEADVQKRNAKMAERHHSFFYSAQESWPLANHRWLDLD